MNLRFVLRSVCVLMLLAAFRDDLIAAVFNIPDGDVGGLIAAMNTANSNGQADTINLATGGLYVLTVVNNTTLGPNGLPVVANEVGGTDITINGNGSTIQRSTASGTPNFRIFEVAQGAGLTINTLTVAWGQVSGTTSPDSFGGGILNNHGTLSLNGCSVKENTSLSESGGGVWSDGSPGGDATVVIINSTFFNNVATLEGGGLGSLAGSLTISNSTFNSNVLFPSGVGGAVSVRGGTASLTNCTIAGNNVNSGSGGGIYNQAASLTVRNCTVAGNNASGGLCIWNTAASGGTATLIISNTILQAGGTGTNVNLKNFPGSGTATITSQGYNLSSDTGGGFLIGTADQINTDPKLVSNNTPANYGGFTFTLALQPGSPAIDKGKDVGGAGVDQRGQLRGFDDPSIAPASGGDNSDIGAFEARDVYQSGSNFVVNTTDDHTDGVCGTTDCSLRDAIQEANAVAGAQNITFSVTGTISLQGALGELAVKGDTTITGPGARLLAIDGNLGTRIFDFMSGTSTVSEVTLKNGAVVGVLNSIVFAGGILNFTTLTLNDCTLTNNGVFGGTGSPGGNGGLVDGGAIENRSMLTVNRCTFTGNSAVGGAGGNNTGPSFGGNGGYGKGGAIYNFGVLVVSNSTFTNNVATGGVGGNSNFGGNGGDGIGGAIDNHSTMTLTSCTFTGNSATAGGGGLGNFGPNNGAPGAGKGGALAQSAGGPSTVANSIVAGNSCTSGGGKDVDGPFTSNGYNLIDSADHSSGFTATGDMSGTDAVPLNAMLGSLQDNGGDTDTIAPLTGSPALDNGNSFGLFVDQRNSLRPVDDPSLANASGGDGSDIGAYEKDVTQTGSTFEVNTTADHNDGSCTLADCSLREAIMAANSHGGADTINFKAGLTGTISLQTALGQLSVGGSTTINGPGARLLTVTGHNALRIFSFNGGSSTVNGMTIRNGFMASPNTATVAAGGGIFNSATLVLNECTLRDNFIFGANSSATGGQGGAAQGAGIYNNGTLTLNRCTLRGNTATAGNGGPNTGFGTGGAGGSANGGGIFNPSGHTLALNNCTFYANNTTGGIGGSGFTGGSGGSATGGAVSNQGTATLTACTISGNSVTTGMGGQGSNHDGASGVVAGGGYESSAGTTTISNTIIAMNTGTNGSPDAKGTFSSSGYNLIGASNGSTGFTATGDQTGTVATPLNPMLTSLQNNGGPTDTLALLYGSPALDNGSAFGLTTDQRNSIRPLDTIFANAVGGDGSDIGAVEMNLLGGSDSDGDGMSDDYELFFGVTDAFADADGDGLTNLDEYYAGTNPLDAASALRIISIMSSGNDIRVSFGIAVLGRTYRLERKDSITDPNWGSINGVSDLTPSAIGNAQITDPGAATMTRHVYHVRTLP